jgi:hypothetical protein
MQAQQTKKGVSFRISEIPIQFSAQLTRLLWLWLSLCGVIVIALFATTNKQTEIAAFVIFVVLSLKNTRPSRSCS